MQNNNCIWSKGLHSFETCWSDVSIADYKKYAMQYCPKCGRKIVINKPKTTEVK